jgi:alanyl-tRNA synthetase
VQNTGRLGLVKLLHESSIGAGVRRVEALVGADAYNILAREHVLLSQVAEVVKARPDELPERVAGIVGKLREAEKEIAALKAGQVLAVAGQLADNPAQIHGVAFVAHRAPDGTGADDLRKLAFDIRARLGSRPSVIALASAANGRPVVLVATNEAAREHGLKAGALAKIAAVALGGGGGGKDDVAQGGGTDLGALDAALEAVRLQIAGTVPA